MNLETYLSYVGGIIVEPPTCGSPETEALIGIGRGPTYLNTSTQSLQICCRVQGPSYTITWLRNGNPIDSRQSGYQFGDDYMRYTGSLSTGCVKYTCQVQFHHDEQKVLSESSDICIGSESICNLYALANCYWVPMTSVLPSLPEMDYAHRY